MGSILSVWLYMDKLPDFTKNRYNFTFTLYTPPPGKRKYFFARSTFFSPHKKTKAFPKGRLVAV